jgi:CheY-like chemotaxis protein
MTEESRLSLNILLVEDDEDDISFFKEAVQKLEFKNEVAVARNCQQLFSYIELNKSFDIIFLDINLPMVDGKQCLKNIKVSELYKDVPIIMFTGSSAQADIDEVYENGAHYHVVKPYAHINYVASLKMILELNWKEKPPRPAKENFVVNLTFN